MNNSKGRKRNRLYRRVAGEELNKEEGILKYGF